MSRAFGSVRQSQVVTTYGPGALIDLPAHSAIVGGLDTWPQGLQEIVELRLSRALQQYTDVPAQAFAPPPATLDPLAARRCKPRPRRLAWRPRRWCHMESCYAPAGSGSPAAPRNED